MNFHHIGVATNNIELTKRPKKKQKGGTDNKKIKIIKIDFDKLNISSDSADFIEVFSN